MTDQQSQAATYEEYMNAGHAAAWDKDWERATKAYSMAIRLRPDSPAAYNSLGLALLQIRPPRLEEALRVYQRAHDLDPDDPLPLEKSADVYERMGRLQDAATQYLAVAEAYLGRHDLEKAIGNWERATRVTPGLIRVHQKLALAYERIGNKRQAVREYLTLAANFQRQQRTDIAIQAVERALRLEPRNPQALNMLQALRSGGELIFADERLKKDQQPEEVEKQQVFGEEEAVETEEETPEAYAKGPIGETVLHALEQLAVEVSDVDMMADPGAIFLVQAIELHRVGEVKNALEAYHQAEQMGKHNPAITMALGSLHIDSRNWKEAIQYLSQVVENPEYASGANHGLGIAHLHTRKTQQATRHLIRTMQLVDVGLAINEDEAGELGAVYDRLLQNLSSADEATLDSLNQRFFDLLTGVDWKQRVELTRHQLEDAITQSPDNILDVATVPAEIIESMNIIDNYIRSRRFNLAMDEVFYVLSKEPEYLAAHIRLGQILIQMDQVSAAVEKYRRIADTYLARDNKPRAREILTEVIQAVPMNVDMRQDLIELLEEDEKWDEIADQYMELARAYQDLGDTNSARTTLNQALQLGQRGGIDKSKTLKILRFLADIEMMRLDMRAALRAYANIRNLDPNDEPARKMLIDLNFRLGDPTGAIRELDSILQFYAQQRNGRAIVELLREWAEKRPKDEGILTRLAAVYQQVKQNQAALNTYTTLLDIQLEHGRHTEACKTLKRILGLQPPNPQQYINLAKQLGC